METIIPEDYYTGLDQFVTNMVINYQENYCFELAHILEYSDRKSEFIIRNHADYLKLLYAKIDKYRESNITLSKKSLENSWKSIIYIEKYLNVKFD